MSVGAICFTSSGSNGGCWVVLVFPRLFFGKMGFFFPYATYAKKKKFTRLTPKKKIFRRKKNATYAKKKKLRDLHHKKNKKATYAYFHNRVTLSSCAWVPEVLVCFFCVVFAVMLATIPDASLLCAPDILMVPCL